MHPHDIPRKHAIRTTLVKNCKKITLAANQRMHANSRNRTRMPVRKRLSPCVRTSICGLAAISAKELVAVLSTAARFPFHLCLEWRERSPEQPDRSHITGESSLSAAARAPKGAKMAK